VGAVTGANFLLESGKLRVMVDCGLLQDPGQSAQNEAPFEYEPASIDYLFITHAHIDHIGRIHKLVRDGFKGVIYSTAETKEIAELMMMDLAHIEGFDDSLIRKALALWQTLKYHEPKDLGGLTVELYNAGHILGSAMYRFTGSSGKSILFTGDLGNSPSPLLPNTDEAKGLTYLLTDSVYGDRNHESPEERDRKLKELITEVIRDKKTLLIPVFSLERTQIMLFELKRIFESGVQSVPVYLDSPLASHVTEIYRRVLTHGNTLFNFPKLTETAQVRDSQEIESVPAPKIILAGSGMSTAGRILHHEIAYLPRQDAMILFVGYQAPGTLGRIIQEGMKEVTIDGGVVPVRAQVVTIEGYSAHAGSDQEVNFASASKDTLKKVFVTMGEPKASIFLAQRLHDELGVDAMVPERTKRYELDL
jgi:metallo-beta-lactamase family protein